jgi:uncharacterized lipoprotein
MMRFFALFSVILLGLCLTACGSHSTTYLKKGREIAPIVVPADVPVIKQQDYYTVPKVSVTPSQKPVSLLPPTLQSS